ncbi:MAG: TonB-dependent receptor [Bacteroidetes bacterium]|nr:TonB-dependent receptor [Bacteroidota bacterium]
MAGASSVFAQTQTQTVTLRDANSGEPLPWATIEGMPSNRYVLTDERGKANLGTLTGDDSLRIRMVGYEGTVLRFPQKEAGNTEFLINPAGFSLDQLVVSATRWEQERESSAAKVISINSRDVALQNPQTAADLLASSGQVFVQKSQLGGGSPMIRGFATNRLLLVVDGVRMNSAIFRSGNLQNVIALDPLGIEKTEVLFGPGSVLYGSDAIGGVMSFRTLQPRLHSGEGLQVSGSVFARTATANWEKTGHADLRLSHKRIASITSFTFTDYDNQRIGSNGPDEYLRPFFATTINGVDSLVANDNPRELVESGYSQFNAMQKMLIRLSDSVQLDYGFHYSRSSDVPRYDRLRRPRNDGLRSAEWYYGPQIWMLNNLTLQANARTSLYDQIRVNLAYQRFEESRNDRNFGATVLNRTSEDVGAFSANLDLQKGLRGDQRVFYGLEGIENVVGSQGAEEELSTGLVTEAPSRYPDGSRWSSYAAYLNYHWEPTSTLNLQAGGRYNYIAVNADFDTAFFPFPFTEANNTYGAFTGSLGAVYKPDAHWLFRVNGGSAFRAPNIDDVGKVFDSEPGSVVIPNPALRPEYAWNAELGVARSFGQSVRIDLTGYHTWLQDALVRRNFSLNGQDSITYAGELSQVQAIQNAAKATVYGFLAAVELKMPAGFGAVLRWNYQVGEEELDDGSTAPLRHAAPWFSTAQVEWTGHNLRLALIAHYHAEVPFEDMPPSETAEDYLYALDESGNPYSPAWYRLDFRLLWQASDAFRISAGIENLTDQRYQPFSSGIAATGLNGVLGLRYAF